MQTPAERLRWARERQGLSTAREGAAQVGVVYDTYAQHENGIRGIPKGRAELYAKAFDVDVAWLLYGAGAPVRRGRSLTLVGKAGAGPDGHFIDDYEMGGGDPLEAEAVEGRIAVQVEGDSMAPRFRSGEILVFGPADPDPVRLVGREVLAVLEDDRRLIKVLRRSATPGAWDLYSINSAFDPIEGVRLKWACPFEALRSTRNAAPQRLHSGGYGQDNPSTVENVLQSIETLAPEDLLRVLEKASRAAADAAALSQSAARRGSGAHTRSDSDS